MARNPDPSAGSGSSRALSRDEAYVDTSALIAFADRSDSHHALFARLFADPPRLVTTALVVAEGQGWFLRRYDQTRALMFLALVEDLQPLSIAEVGAEEVAAATALLRRFGDQRFTLADALGLHVMSARRIQTCWSTDRHLGLTGVPLAIG
jgi:predicted nucleic acid-binding protein